MPAVAKPVAARTPRWPLVAIFAVTIIVYMNALHNALLWDDQYLIIDNPQIKDWRHLTSLLWSDLFPPVMPSGYYRPLQALANMFDYSLWGVMPFGYHVTNTLLHGVTALLLYRFGVALMNDWPAALVAALLFAVHPIHTEAVTYIAGRSDPLAGLCMLASLIWFLADRQRVISWQRMASVAAFALALLAREAAVVLILLLVLVDVTTSVRSGQRLTLKTMAVRHAPYVLVLAGYALLREAALTSGPLAGPPADLPLATRLLTLPKVIVAYLALLVVPVDLHMERVVTPATRPFEPAIAGATLIVTALLAAAIGLRRRAWPVAFGVAWFLIALLPVSNVIPLATFMAEHWLYVPSMGLFLAVGWGAARAASGEWQQPVATAVLLAVVAYGALTIRRNQDWRDEVTLYEATVRLAPQSARAWTNLAHAYRQRGETAKADAAFQHALQRLAAPSPSPVLPTDAAAAAGGAGRVAAYQHSLMGNILRQLGQHDAAEREFRQAVRVNPADVSALNNLGLTLETLQKSDAARSAFETAIRLYPEFAAAHSNLGNHYFRQGDLEAALQAYHTAVALNPEYAEAYNNLGSAYFRMGRSDLALDAYRQALQLNPGLSEVRRNLDVVERAGVAGGTRSPADAARTAGSASAPE